MSRKEPLIFNTTFSTYTEHKLIGEGGSGRVYLAKEDNGTSFAIKLLDPSKATKERLKRFENEYCFCSMTDHPNIIRVMDHGLHIDLGPFFVMPLYDSSLRKLMTKGISPKSVLSIFEMIMKGVEAAHLLNVVHRDLKPENILVRNNGEELVVADFGIARFTADELYTAVETKAHARLANFQYAAPEQRMRGLSIDKRTDIYSMGLILNEMYTGTIPLGTNFKTIGSITEEYGYLDSLVAAMLSQDPEKRPNSIREIRRELNARQNEYLSQQKISKLKQTVIAEEEIDDPLAEIPPTLIDADWDGSTLTLKLDKEVHNKWLNALFNMGSYSWVPGRGPERFSFSGDIASVSASEHEVQAIVNHFKDWLPKATNHYKAMLIQEQQKAIRIEKEELSRKLRLEEQRQRVLDNLKI